MNWFIVIYKDPLAWGSERRRRRRTKPSSAFFSPFIPHSALSIGEPIRLIVLLRCVIIIHMSNIIGPAAWGRGRPGRRKRQRSLVLRREQTRLTVLLFGVYVIIPSR